MEDVNFDRQFFDWCLGIISDARADKGITSLEEGQARELLVQAYIKHKRGLTEAQIQEWLLSEAANERLVEA